VSQLTDHPSLTRTAGEDLLDRRLVRLNSSNELVYCDAGEVPLGPIGENVSDGDDIAVALLTNKEGTFQGVAAGTFSLLAPLYTQADGKIDDINTGVRIGWALEACSYAAQYIEFLPDLAQVAIVNAAAATAVGASSTDEEDIDVTAFIPANNIRAGSMFRIKACGIVVDQDSTPQCDVKLYAGTELIATATVAAAADNDQCIIEADLVVRTIGSSGTLIALAKTSFDAAGTALVSALKASATEDTTSGLTIKCTATFSASHADNSFRLDLLSVEQLN